MFRHHRVCRRSSIHTAGGTSNRSGHPASDRLDVKGVALPATALNFDCNHNIEVDDRDPDLSGALGKWTGGLVKQRVKADLPLRAWHNDDHINRVYFVKYFSPPATLRTPAISAIAAGSPH